MNTEIVSVVGLGYVGLPLASALADHYHVIGFDVDLQRIKELSMGVDRTGELPVAQQLLKRRLDFVWQPESLKDATFHIIAVPTPIDEANRPDLTALFSATRTVGAALKKGDMVVYESTVYPGCTEEDCVPILEEVSGLKCGVDFLLGYSPERINPGDREHTLDKVTKLISAQCQEGQLRIGSVYSKICTSLHCTRDIKTAEASKIIENTQRDVNIALMNEFAIICDKMGVDTHEVLRAAATKWNFNRYFPGLVGGHCIGVDPYYLIEKSERLGYNPQMLKACRRINDGMGKFIAHKAIKTMVKRGGLPLRPVATVLGFTFKENCPDIRNTKVIDIIAELRQFGFEVQVHDPVCHRESVFEEYGVEVSKTLYDMPKADVLIIATAHDEYRKMTTSEVSALIEIGAPIIDVKGILSDEIRNAFKYPVVRI